MPPVVPSSSSSDTGNRTVTLSNGVEMPTVGFGCAGYVRKPALLEALAAGYRLFDTAQATEWYLEDELGAALAEAPHVNQRNLGRYNVTLADLRPLAQGLLAKRMVLLSRRLGYELA